MNDYDFPSIGNNTYARDTQHMKWCDIMKYIAFVPGMGWYHYI